MMRAAVAITLALCAYVAGAFDRAEWLGRRESFDREAERMRAEYVRCAKLATAPAENVSVPIETFADGSVKSSVHAEKAQYFLDSGYVWGENVTLRQRRPDGSTEAEVVAASCLIDRKTKCGWAEGTAVATYGRNRLSGKGVYFAIDRRYFKVYGETELVAEGFGFGKGLAGATAGAGIRTKDGARGVLTSRRADYDGADGVVLFEGEVRVDDGECRLGGDRLWAFTAGTNTLTRIEAVGGVWLTNGLRSAACDTAIYDRAAGRLDMTSSGRTPARLVEESRNRSEICGETITFWIDSEQVEVKRSTVTIGAGGEAWKRTL